MNSLKHSVYSIGTLCITAAAFMLVGCEQGSAPPLSSNQFTERGEFLPITVIDHAFEAIIKPAHSSPDEASMEINPDELVLGVEVNGEAKAYPINMLTGPQREIINDELGGIPIAATW